MSTVSYIDSLPQDFSLLWYQLEGVLGRGGFGITYLAKDNNLDHQVAIKEYFPSSFASRSEQDSTVKPITATQEDVYNWGLKNFITEAKTLAKFKHPNIVRVLSVFDKYNTAYMVMEYEQGEVLSDEIKQGKHFNEEELLAVALPLIEGLAVVHDAGFIHRDIKPSNILIREDGSPVLLDFGSARYAVGEQTHTLTSMVTFGYAPFEQYNEGNSNQGPWTDIYGLAATLYCVLTGHPPLDAMKRAAALTNELPDPLLPVSKLLEGKYSAHFLNAVDCALCFNIKGRPQCAQEWMDMLTGKTICDIADRNAINIGQNTTRYLTSAKFSPPAAKNTALTLKPASKKADWSDKQQQKEPLTPPKEKTSSQTIVATIIIGFLTLSMIASVWIYRDKRLSPSISSPEIITPIATNDTPTQPPIIPQAIKPANQNINKTPVMPKQKTETPKDVVEKTLTDSAVKATEKTAAKTQKQAIVKSVTKAAPTAKAKTVVKPKPKTAPKPVVKAQPVITKQPVVQAQKKTKMAEKPKPVTKTYRPIGQEAPILIEKFLLAFQQKSLKTLLSFSQLSSQKENFIQVLFREYESIELQVNDLKMYQSKNEAEAELEIYLLITKDGNNVKPAQSWKQIHLKIKADNSGKMFIFWQ